VRRWQGEAGQPILCENPIDVDIDKVEECRERLAAFDMPVQLGFNRRFDPSHAGKPGTVVNVATVTAHGGVSFLTIYAASKAALVATTKNAAFSLMRDGIRINALAIGWMDTPVEDITQRTFHDMPDGWLRAAGARLPAGRLLNMNEVARWIAHLASDESGIMTGSVLDFDQGVIGCYEATPLPERIPD